MAHVCCNLVLCVRHTGIRTIAIPRFTLKLFYCLSYWARNHALLELFTRSLAVHTNCTIKLLLLSMFKLGISQYRIFPIRLSANIDLCRYTNVVDTGMARKSSISATFFIAYIDTPVSEKCSDISNADTTISPSPSLSQLWILLHFMSLLITY